MGPGQDRTGQREWKRSRDGSPLSARGSGRCYFKELRRRSAVCSTATAEGEARRKTCAHAMALGLDGRTPTVSTRSASDRRRVPLELGSRRSRGAQSREDRARGGVGRMRGRGDGCGDADGQIAERGVRSAQGRCLTGGSHTQKFYCTYRAAALVRRDPSVRVRWKQRVRLKRRWMAVQLEGSDTCCEIRRRSPIAP